MTQKIYFLFVIIKESACIQHGTVVDSTALYGSLEKWLVFCTVITWLRPGPDPTRLRTWHQCHGNVAKSRSELANSKRTKIGR